MSNTVPWAAVLFRKKPIQSYKAEAEAERLGEEKHVLVPTMGLFQVTMLGVGATVGTGIFIILTQAVPKAGPGVILSFAIAGVTAGLTALCYAELASTIPLSGSSYSYAYATLGELAAYLVGWCLLLEYAVSASAIAVGWGQYLNEMFVDIFGWRMPDVISQPPGHGGYFNLPSIALVAMCCFLLLRGARESATINAVMVIIKILILLLFIVIAFSAFKPANLLPFAPFGIAGIGSAASSIFFSYIGLDAVSTAGEEVKNPQRTLPLAIILSLLLVTGLYMLVALAGIGAQPWTSFAKQQAGLAVILRNLTGGNWGPLLISIGAVISIFSVTLVVLYGQTRILFSMGRDGMLPQWFYRVDARSTPVHNTIVVSVFSATLAAFIPLDVLADLTSMGTLVSFAVVSAGVLILRRTQPDLPRGFKVPLYPIAPILSVAFCLYLIGGLPAHTYELFAVWLSLALVSYFSYGIRNSRLAPSRAQLSQVAEP
jgi:basic amino acid/polyamine antiporter, APA family